MSSSWLPSRRDGAPAVHSLESRHVDLRTLNEQIGYEFAASQQYIAVAVYYDAQSLHSSPRTSTVRRSRSETTR